VNKEKKLYFKIFNNKNNARNIKHDIPTYRNLGVGPNQITEHY